MMNEVLMDGKVMKPNTIFFEQEFHVELCSSGKRESFFAGKPGSIFNHFSNILQFQIGIIFEDFFRRLTRGKQIKNHVNRNSHPTDAGLTTQFVCFNGNTWKNFHLGLIISQTARGYCFKAGFRWPFVLPPQAEKHKRRYLGDLSLYFSAALGIFKGTITDGADSINDS